MLHVQLVQSPQAEAAGILAGALRMQRMLHEAPKLPHSELRAACIRDSEHPLQRGCGVAVDQNCHLGMRRTPPTHSLQKRFHFGPENRILLTQNV